MNNSMREMQSGACWVGSNQSILSFEWNLEIAKVEQVFEAYSFD